MSIAHMPFIPFTRRLALAATLGSVVMLGACATASGPQFSTLEAVPASQAHVYLYRKSALYASGAAFAVTHNGKDAGKLYNASHLVLPVSAGAHQFAVDEGGFASAKKFSIHAEAGKRYYVAYDSSNGLLLGGGLLSGTATKSETQALADLKDLKRAQ
jgi:hypothetical protein